MSIEAGTTVPPSVDWVDGRIRIIDQRAIPGDLVVRDLESLEEVIEAIHTLAVRGANVIGCTGALGLVLAIEHGMDAATAAQRLIDARPTAVTLPVAVSSVLDAHLRGDDVLAAALALIAADRAQCTTIGEIGRVELAGATTLLTHCNTGRLATAGWGTALGIVYAKHAAGEPVSVFATETRPLQQGARLTAWELAQSGIDVQLVIDSAAASLLATGRVDAVVVGADRIAANGDTANKIGTRALAIAAKREGVPFYVVATRTAIDVSTRDGSGIPIELRDGDEVRPPALSAGIPVWNPAFDVTPADLITGIITEAGVLRPDFTRSIAEVAGP